MFTIINVQPNATISQTIKLILLNGINMLTKHRTESVIQHTVNNISHHQLKCFSFIDTIITASFQNATTAKKQVKNIRISDVPIKIPLIILSTCSIPNNIALTVNSVHILNDIIPSAHKYFRCDS